MILRMCVSSLLLLLAASSYGVESYSQVSMSGSAAGSGPKVFKAMNMDLIYPRTFNSSENVISTTEAQPSAENVGSMSPAADDQSIPNDSVSAEEEPISVESNYPPTFVFPSNHADESRYSQTTLPPTATGRAVDYSPEYPFTKLLSQNNNGYRPSPTAYRPEPRHRAAYPNNYQASGTPSRAEFNKLSVTGQFSETARAGGEVKDSFTDGHAGYHYQSSRTPSDAGFAPKMRAVDMVRPPPMMRKVDKAPSPPAMNVMGMMANSGPPADLSKEYPTPPPGYMEEHDQDHHDHHKHPEIDFAEGPYFQGHDYPDHHHHHDVVYDDYHDHHHDEHDHHTEPPPTEPPPPPPPPVKHHLNRYSYWYIGRKMWYVQLYFILWFTCYVLWMIIKSIGRHKVGLPNHYFRRRDISELSHREAREAIDKITLRIMDGIEKFKMKYIG